MDNTELYEGVRVSIHAALVAAHELLSQGVLYSASDALSYLDAVTPYTHPARLPLMELIDCWNRWRTHGDPNEDAPTVGKELISSLVEAYSGLTPPVYTLATPEDILDYVDSEELTIMTVRIFGQSGGSLVGGSTQVRHNAPGLVFYTDGLPHAQVSISALVGMSAIPGMLGAVSRRMPCDRCGHGDCANPPVYAVRIGTTIYITCTEHVMHLLNELGTSGAHIMRLTPPTSPA